MKPLSELLKLCDIEENIPKHLFKNIKMVSLGMLFDTEALTLSVTHDRMADILKILEEQD